MKKNVNTQHYSSGKSNITRHLSFAELKYLYDEIEEEHGISADQWPAIKLWHIEIMQVAFVLTVGVLAAQIF